MGRSVISQDLGALTTAKEAVALAVHHLPPGPAPVARSADEPAQRLIRAPRLQ
ncbi:hypothetical protein [Actinacidiphila sp. bgisy160]|uniref:hypothetical protein n=1 Tax=Actinacidiphila sp. bgisy160 TaxID=3413796 RepID=UPI003D764AC9